MIKQIFFFTLLILHLPLLAQNKYDYVAKYGNEHISQMEFKMRFETMPHVLDDYYNLDSVKLKVLNTIIAEKLWANEAVELGIDTTQYFKKLFSPVERIFVRDALFQKEVFPKIDLSPKDISFISGNSNVNCNVDIYAFDDSTNAINSFNNLISNKPIDKNIAYMVDTTQVISIGSLEEEELERNIFSIKNGDFIPPFNTENGWFFIKLKYRSKIDPNTDKAKYVSTLKQKVIERRAKKYGTEYLKILLSDIQFNIDNLLLSKLSNVMYKRIMYRIEKDSTLTFKSILIDEQDVNYLISTFSKTELYSPFINTKTNSYSLNDFLIFVMFEDFITRNPTQEGLTKKIVDFIKYYIEQEMITQEGYRLELNNSPSVLRDLEMWKDNFLAQLVQNRQVDTIIVSDEEVISFYNNKFKYLGTTTEVNIQEILCDNLEKIELVLSELERGNDFGELANQYSIRERTKGRNGEFGFFPITLYGEIGQIAATLKLNQIYGPIKTNEGYSIIKLIDKKEDKTNKSFSELKEMLKEEVKANKTYNLLDDKTSKLALKYGVEINENALKNIKVINVNMFTHRFMGFGGKVAGAPFANQIYKWYNIYKKEKKDNL